MLCSGRLKLTASEVSQVLGSGLLFRNIFRSMPFRLSENAFLVEDSPSNEEKDFACDQV